MQPFNPNLQQGYLFVLLSLVPPTTRVYTVKYIQDIFSSICSFIISANTKGHLSLNHTGSVGTCATAFLVGENPDLCNHVVVMNLYCARNAPFVNCIIILAGSRLDITSRGCRLLCRASVRSSGLLLLSRPRPRQTADECNLHAVRHH